ncbi:hypothetical protein [Microbacterium sp. CH12i]|uniref:hypothetical protein n=1 Tax=Microbacterium sp. CH12i TaxID=1479651 RepID=UPI00190FB9B2|nr:hypothetical protein [Microbacterium sp. CH12i]
MDLERDAPAAFGPASLTAGSLLPFEGRTLMQGPEGLPSAVLDAEQDGWVSPNNPILVRGLAKILPLAWWGDGSGVKPEEIAAFASQMQAAGMQWAGNWRVLDITERRDDSIGSYSGALRAAGATLVDCWTYSQTIGVALVWAGAADDATRSLALHVVPVGWVSERLAKKPLKGIDVRWSWAEVVTLFAGMTGTALPVAADSLADVGEEELG